MLCLHLKWILLIDKCWQLLALLMFHSIFFGSSQPHVVLEKTWEYWEASCCECEEMNKYFSHCKVRSSVSVYNLLSRKIGDLYQRAITARNHHRLNGGNSGYRTNDATWGGHYPTLIRGIVITILLLNYLRSYIVIRTDPRRLCR